jgi:hypothetical protein
MMSDADILLNLEGSDLLSNMRSAVEPFGYSVKLFVSDGKAKARILRQDGKVASEHDISTNFLWKL